jgi:hypothetical protein
MAELYSMGVRTSEDINEENVKKLISGMKKNMFTTVVWQGFMREQAKGLDKPFIDDNSDRSWANHPKIAYLDAEYVDKYNVVLYGFLVDGKIIQFNMTQTKDVKKLANRLIADGYKIFHYGGQDKNVILELFDPNEHGRVKAAFVNVYYMLEQQIGLPVKSLNVHVVAAYLKSGKKTEPEGDGMLKAMMCSEILSEYEKKKSFKTMKSYKDLIKTNKEDLVDLQLIIDKFKALTTEKKETETNQKKLI